MPNLAAARRRSSLMKFRPLTVIVPTEKIMKQAIKTVLEFIYDTESPEASRVSIRNQIKDQWRGCDSFLKLKIGGESFIDPHRLVPILREEIDDPNLFRKLFSTFRNSAILSTVAGNIYMRKLRGVVWSPIGVKFRLGFKEDQQRNVVFSTSSSSLVAFLNRPSSLLGAAVVGH